MVDKYLSLLEAEIRRQRFGESPASLYEPIRYIMALGGKRLRPLLTLLSYALYKNDAERIVKYAVAVEAFHNFTLLHDDIMDKAPLRRGKATVHEKWNVNTAILSGDVMLVKVYDMLLDIGPSKLQDVLALFNQCASEVCEGQQWDMEFESMSRVTEAQYIAMIRQKTAVLLGFSLELGALLADAAAADRGILRQAGIDLGLGFQLKDDLLDVYGSKKKFGKQIGGDIIANKKTFLLIKALQLARGKEKAELLKWLGAKKFDRKKKVAAITAVYDKLRMADVTNAMIAESFARAFEGLQKLSAKENLNTLLGYARDLAERQQ
ncbi:MAG TPA: polyprenyl synthetase family protein [Cyclobacteriaceae bacterium]|nr:polyprenyl synthetase family protein [Cyclobacteriaceae bacterium]